MAQANIDINLLFNDGGRLESVISKLEKVRQTTQTLSKEQRVEMGKMINATMKAAEEMNKLSGQLKNSMKPKDISNIVTQIKKQSDAIDKVNKNLKKETGLLGGLKAQLKKLKLDREFAKTEKEVVGLNKKIQDTEMKIRSLSNVGKKETNTLANAFGSFGFKFNLLANIASRVGSAFTSGIIRVFRDSISTIMDFEQAQATLASILQKSRSEISALTEDAKRYGATTFFTATQVEELQIELAKLGFTLEQIQGATKGALDLAAAFRVDLATAAQVTASTVRGFNLEAEESGRVADVIASGFANSALDLEKFQVAINKVAPIAANMNISLEATTAALGTLVNVGFDASTAGTQLRNILLKLSDGSSDLTKRLGGTVNSTEDFLKAFESLNKQGLKIADTQQLIDKRSVALLQALTNNAGATRELTEEFENAAGTAQKIASEQLKTLRGAILLLESAWSGFVLSIQDGQGSFAQTIKTIIEVIATLFNLSSGLENSGKVLSDHEKKIRSYAETLKNLLRSLGFVVAAIVSTKTAMLVLNPIIKIGRSAMSIFATSTTAAATATTGLGRAAIFTSTAMRGLFRIVRKNPLTILITVLSVAADKLLELAGFYDEAAENVRIFNNEVDDQIGKNEILFRTLKSQNATRREQQKALEELTSVYGEYLDDLKDEKGQIKDIAELEKRVADVIRSKTAERFKEQEVQNEIIKKNEQISKSIENLIETRRAERKEILESDNVHQDTIELNKKQLDSLEESSGRFLLSVQERSKAVTSILRDNLDTTEEELAQYLQADKSVQGSVKSFNSTMAKFQDLELDTMIDEEFRKQAEDIAKIFGETGITVGEVESVLRELTLTNIESGKAVDGIVAKYDKYKLKLKEIADAGKGFEPKEGRLIKIKKELDEINTKLESLSAKYIDDNPKIVDGLLERQKALQLERKLIISIRDEEAILAEERAQSRENSIRKVNELNSSFDIERELIKLNSQEESEALAKRKEALQEDLKLINKRILQNEGAAKTQAEIRAQNIQSLIDAIELTEELSEAEKKRALAEIDRQQFIAENQNTLALEDELNKQADLKNFFLDKRAENELIGLNKQADLLAQELDKFEVSEERKTEITLQQEQIRTRIAEIEADKRDRIIAMSIDAIKQGLDTASTLNQVSANKQTADVKKSRDEQLRIIQQQLDNGIISEEQYQLRKEYFEEQAAKKIAEIKAEQARKDKQLAIIQAIIDGAVAIQKIQSQLGIAAPPFIAASVATTAAQIALIESQPIPEFEKGGLIEGGLLQGKRHSQGGITLEAEGGEFINSRKSTSAYFPYLKAANEMRLPEFIMANDVKPMLEVQLAGLHKSFADNLSLSAGFYDGNLLRAMKKDREIQKHQLEMLSKLASPQHKNLRA